MAIATIGALLIGFLPGAEAQMPEAVFVMLFFQLGELFEDYAEDKSRDSIAEMMDIRPDTANVERQGHVMTVSPRSEEHTSELQSRQYLVCRLLLEKKKRLTSTKQIHKNKLH